MCAVPKETEPSSNEPTGEKTKLETKLRLSIFVSTYGVSVCVHTENTGVLIKPFSAVYFDGDSLIL